MKISILSMFRDSESILNNILNSLYLLELSYPKTEFEYFFYENDSVDNTKPILEEWLSSRKGHAISDVFSAPKFGRSTSLVRMSWMAKYRNRLLDSCRPLKSDYAILLDSDVIFKPGVLLSYLSTIKSDIAMMTPNVTQNIKCKMCDCDKDSYYDCLALLDTHDNQGMIWSCNPFFSKKDRNLWDSGELVEVNSAFGGYALIRSDVLNEVSWDTNVIRGCEHLKFCENVRKYGKVVVSPTTTVSVHIEDTYFPHADLLISKQKEKLGLLNSIL